MLTLMFLSRTTAQRRSFVSTVLLSRTWDTHTVVELRKEAKARGLSTKGNKSTLIARIQAHEHDSTSPPRTKKLSQAASPGIPLPAQPDSPSAQFLAVKLPDLSRQPPSPHVPIPHVPDFWNSARPKPDVLLDAELPKLHVVSGFATHYNGGPIHNLEKHHEDDGSLSTIVQADPLNKRVSFWAEFWESLGLPRSFSIRRSLSEAAAKIESQTQSRSLTDKEKRGLYVLFGIVGGSWLIGSVVNRPMVIPEETVLSQ